MENTAVRDEFLNNLSGKEVTVYLVNGIKLQGNLTAFDNAVLGLVRASIRDGKQFLSMINAAQHALPPLEITDILLPAKFPLALALNEHN